MTLMSSHEKYADPEWFAGVPRSITKHTLIGLSLIAVCFGGFGTWALTAPLAAAVIAQGSFVATGQNKIVQHLEGGIIKDILVDEGDHVQVNQPLILLDRTAAQANERQLFLRQARLEAITARLTAEAENSPNIKYPEVLSKSLGDPDVSAIIDSQEQHFRGSQSRLNSEIGLLNQNIEALKYRAEGYKRQLDSMKRQHVLLEEEYEGKKILLSQGLIRKTEVSAIRRAIADAEGQSGQLASEVAETNAQIKKLDQQIIQTISTFSQASLDELQKIEAELDNVREESRAAENVLERASINAPVAGTVVRMYYHTAGGVIESGKSILEILPADVPLIIEAQIPRTEIDNVKQGQNATVRLTALNQRKTPVLNGKVFYVSADSLALATGDAKKEVYLARINLPGSELSRVPGFSPTPGMPAEIFIQTAERTFFNYITKPITDSMSKAFMEP
jgi:HlyD family type I secretion membrane fusion protein